MEFPSDCHQMLFAKSIIRFLIPRPILSVLNGNQMEREVFSTLLRWAEEEAKACPLPPLLLCMGRNSNSLAFGFMGIENCKFLIIVNLS